MLKVRNLTSGYGETLVLRDVGLNCHEGSVHALLGRNGAGKTTFLRTLIGQCPALHGSIEFMGRDVHRLPSYERARLGMGYVPETRDIFASLTVLENLQLAARLANRHNTWNVSRILSLFPNLKDRLQNSGHALSGGEQQMLCIARALISNAKIILLDEPSEGLAPSITRSIFACLQQLKQQGVTIILVEQNYALALQLADYVTILERGQRVWHGQPSDVDTSSRQCRQWLGL